jgi:hypothetical protein
MYVILQALGRPEDKKMEGGALSWILAELIVCAVFLGLS